MEGFTPTFFLQVVIAIGTAGAVYGAIKADLKNMHARLENEIRLREAHATADDLSFHDVREHLVDIGNRVSVIEGRAQR